MKSHFVIVAEMKDGATKFMSRDESSGGYPYFTDSFPTMWLSAEEAQEYLSIWEKESNRHYVFDQAIRVYVKQIIPSPTATLSQLLDENQIKNAARWIKEHECSRRNDYAGAIGGRYTYSFTPTGLGVIVSIKCWCGAELDLTDNEDW